MTTPVGVLRLKPSVRFDRIEPAGFRILAALDNSARVMGIDMTISCGTEGHPPTDPHTTGDAYDVSVAGWSILITLKVHQLLKQLLGDLFTVLYEAPTAPEDPDLRQIVTINPAATAPHLHIQRKRGTVFPPAPREATRA